MCVNQFENHVELQGDLVILVELLSGLSIINDFVASFVVHFCIHGMKSKKPIRVAKTSKSTVQEQCVAKQVSRVTKSLCLFSSDLQ